MRDETLSTSEEARRRVLRRAALACCLLVPVLILVVVSTRSILKSAEDRRLVLAETYRQVADLVASSLSTHLIESERYLVDELSAGAPTGEELVRRVASWSEQDETLRPMALLGPEGELMQPFAGTDSGLEALIAARPAAGADAVVVHSHIPAADGEESSEPSGRDGLSGQTATGPACAPRSNWALDRRLRTISCQVDRRQYRYARAGAVAVLRLLVANRFEVDRGVYERSYEEITGLLDRMPLDAETRATVDELKAEARRRDSVAADMGSLLARLREIPAIDDGLRRPQIDIVPGARPGEALVFAELPGLSASVVHRLGGEAVGRVLDEVLAHPGPWSDAGVALVDDSGRRLDAGSGAAPDDAALATIPVVPGWSVAAFPLSGSLEALARQELRYNVMILAAALVAFAVGAVLAGRGLHRELAVSRMRSDFVSSVSHELKTPLALLSASAENLRAGWVPEERRDEYYETMVAETRRLSDLVDNVLSFRRMESGARTYRFRLTDLRDLVDETLARYRDHLRSNRIDLEVDVPDEPVLAHVDRDGLDQVLVNLLSNAGKYMRDDDRRARVTLATAGERVRLSVSDSGIGMAGDELERIFEPFYRGGDPAAESVAGSGIGLSIVRHIVDAHEGTIDVDSARGEGTTFTVSLPVRPLASAERRDDRALQ